MATNNSWNSTLPIPVASGGTGLSSSASTYGVVCGGTSGTAAFQIIANGSSSKVLTSSGAGSLPTWTTISGGSVSGPGSSTNLAIATWNGTGGTALLNNSTVTVDASGRIKKTGQPCFFVNTGSTSPSAITGDGTLATITWDTGVFDQNSNFNTGTYTFTAPVTGKYCFNINPTWTGGFLHAELFINAVTTGTTFSTFIINPLIDYRAGSQLGGFTLPMITQMTAADTLTVTIQCQQGGGGDNTKNVKLYNPGGTSAYCVLDGFLIC